MPADGGPGAGPAVAVVGMGVAVPGAQSPAELWQLLNSDPTLLAEPPAERWRTADYVGAGDDKTSTQAGGFVLGMPGEDPQADFATTWLRHCIVQALQGVGRAPSDRHGVCVGYTADGSLHQEEALWREEALAVLQSSGRFAAVTAGRLGAALERRYVRAGAIQRYLPHRVVRAAVQGILPADAATHLIDTACSSSLYAVDLGARLLVEGAVDVALCGGALTLTPTSSVLFGKNGGLAPGGVIRALDALADGVLFSDGVGVVVLKLLNRALADGDEVFGLVVAAGLSADGRGRAIYAPSADGQRTAIDRALRRARTSAGFDSDDVGLVVAHATGTPAGDSAELAALRDLYAGGVERRVVSNKSLIGHTGWAAGAVSVVHALLAMRLGSIPRQPHFTREATAVDLAGTGLAIPRATDAWPSRPGGRPRAAAVSGFGFGGTNAHLLLQELQAGTSPACGYLPEGSHDTAADEVVVVGWAADEPGNGDDFGDDYPPPSTDELQLPGRTVRRLDRTQLMLVRCMHRLPPAVRELCAGRNDRVGVVVGHCGPTRNALLYRSRAHYDELAGVLVGPCSRVEERLAVQEFLEDLRRRVLGRIAPPTEDSYPGEMPNVIAGRLANTFDLRGLNVTVDQGEASLLEAFDLAARYLRFGDVELALVGGASGNSLPPFAAMLGADRVREAGYLFALTTRAVAEAAGVPILAEIETELAAGQSLQPGSRSGTSAAGAEGGREIVAFLSGDDPDLDVRRRADPEEPERRLVLRRRPGAARQAPTVLERHVVRLAPLPERQPADRSVALFPRGTLVVTDDATHIPSHVSTVEVGADGLRYRGQSIAATEAGVARLVADLRPTHLRVVVHLDGATGPFDPDDPAHRTVRRVHDATFLAVRALADDLIEESSVVVTLIGGIDVDGVVHPLSGLFTGFTKVLALEYPSTLIQAVLHDAGDLAAALEDVEAELGSRQLLPVVHLAAGRRLGVRAEREPAPDPATLPLNPESVVVAAGGARGIGAEILKAVARAVGPRIYVLGSSPLNGDAARDRAVLDAGRAAFIRDHGDWMTVASANGEFDRLMRTDEARGNLAELARHCGSDRVTYLRCDVRDSAAVELAVDGILGAGQPVDLLINVAGLIRTTLVGQKSLADFAAVRDVKLLAHANLTRAFGPRRPRLWCNFGSYAGFFGAPGETDYAGANDFLYSVAPHAPGEFTIGFSLWGEDGFASKGLFRTRMDHVALLTPMSTAEGVGHFLAELAMPTPAPATVQLGQRERTTIDQTIPGYLPWCGTPSPTEPATRTTTSASATTTARAETGALTTESPGSTTYPTAVGGAGFGFFVDQVVTGSDGCLTASRTFDLERDGYLLQHLVGGHPTLPGSFYPELAAQLAHLLCPAKVAVAFEDIRLESFLRVYGPERPHTVQIAAQRRAFDRVHVRILHDVVAPNGRVLVQERLHASLDVRLGDRPIPAPHWPVGNGDPSHPPETLINPLYLPTDAINLSGMFRLTSDERRGPNGSQQARLIDRSADARRWFPDSRTPLLVLEAVAQMLKVQPRTRPMAVAVPRRIRRIELFAAQAAPTELHCSPRDADLFLEADDATNRGVSVAVTPDGQVSARISGMYVAVLARLPQEAPLDDERAAVHQAR